MVRAAADDPGRIPTVTAPGQKRIGDPLTPEEDEERADLYEPEPWEAEEEDDQDIDDM
jgi:hypothetical protein